jgi:site-specific recombinase XerD
MSDKALGPLVQAFIVDHLQVQKRLRPSSVRSYRDGLRLFLQFVAKDRGRGITRLSLEDLTFERVLGFLRHLEEQRGNHIRTRNQRLALLHAFFTYVAQCVPEMLAVAERVAAIPTKRVAPPEAHYLERDEVRSLFAQLPSEGRYAVRDRALLLFLYNTGARVQEVADLRVQNLELDSPPRVALHGKGDKWRFCPLWAETAEQLRHLLEQEDASNSPNAPVFVARRGAPLSRFGIYKVVRRHASCLDSCAIGRERRRVTPHVFRHTTAVHLLEAGVEVNVVRGWLGHVSLDTTHRYAEITVKAKQAALEACEPPLDASASSLRRSVWRNDHTLLAWLDSL